MFAYKNLFCKHCSSYNIIKYGFNIKMLISNDEKQNHIRVQKYLCYKCNKISQTEFNDDYEPYCNFLNKTKSRSCETISLECNSLINTSYIHKIYNNLSISYETVRTSIKVIDSNSFRFNNFELSGYYGYDEQWFKTSCKKQYSYTLFDLIANVPYC